VKSAAQPSLVHAMTLKDYRDLGDIKRPITDRPMRAARPAMLAPDTPAKGKTTRSGSLRDPKGKIG
jgi:hypothetical protein